MKFTKRATDTPEGERREDTCMVGEGMHKDAGTFKIASLQDAEAFEAYINRYGEATSFSGYDMRGAILNIYKYSRVHSKDDQINGQLLNASVDLELTYLFIMKDSLLAGGAYNRLHDIGKIALGSVLDDFELFSGKLDILYALSAFSFRMRAFWDKYMGVLFLLYEHNRYDKYVDARSRKKFFMRHAQEWPEISVHLRKCLTNIVRTGLINAGQREAVRDIDNRKLCIPFPDPFLKILGEIIAMVDAVRTPEAHGAGFLRKWALANLPIDKSRDFALMNHWNMGNEFMQALRTTIAEYSAQSSMAIAPVDSDEGV